jgi:hypothetical protein
MQVARKSSYTINGGTKNGRNCNGLPWRFSLKKRMHSHSGHSFDLFSFIAVVAIVVIGFIVSAIAASKRREGLLELAARLNLNFDPEQDESLPERFAFFKQFSEGHDRYASNVISGNYQGNEILAFDYHYATGSGKSRQDYHLSFFILVMPGIWFPAMTIRPEGFFDRVAEAFGAADIKFESVEFSSAFCVRSSDKKFAFDVCNPKMMEFLLSNRGLSIEIENGVMALFFNRKIAVQQFEPDLQCLAQIRALMPDYLFTPA